MSQIVDIVDNPLRKGKFTAGGIAQLMTGFDKKEISKTALNYIYDVACDAVGTSKDFETKEMQHGKVNQVYGFSAFMDVFGKKNNLKCVWHDDFIVINEKCGASPDAIGHDCVIDIKCPYNIPNYIEQNETLKKSYYLQVQMQIIAHKCSLGYLVNYLTKPELYGDNVWVEYPFDINERIFYHEIKSDESEQEKILSRVDECYPILLELIEKLKLAKVYEDDILFFYEQMYSGKRYVELKDKNWRNIDEVPILYNGKYYVNR